jgi:hypothetical protein
VEADSKSENSENESGADHAPAIEMIGPDFAHPAIVFGFRSRTFRLWSKCKKLGTAGEVVIAGLDPAIHLVSKKAFREA